MNIAYVAPDFLPNNNAGSIRNSFFVDALQKDNHNVFVFSSFANKKYQMILNRLKLPGNKEGNIKRLFKEICFSIEMFLELFFIKKWIYILFHRLHFLWQSLLLLPLRLKIKIMLF